MANWTIKIGAAIWAVSGLAAVLAIVGQILGFMQLVPMENVIPWAIPFLAAFPCVIIASGLLWGAMAGGLLIFRKITRQRVED